MRKRICKGTLLFDYYYFYLLIYFVSLKEIYDETEESRVCDT